LYSLKKIYLIILVIISAIPYSHTQQQQHIPWPSLADSPWPIGRGDAQATGRSKYIGPRTANVLWRKDMPLGILHGPVIGYNNELFLGTDAVNLSAGENYFYSIDNNGKDVWTFITEGYRANEAGATIGDDGTIYFGSLGTSATGVGGIYAINPDGTLKWRNKRFMQGFLTRYYSITRDSKLVIPWSDSIFILSSQTGSLLDSFYVPGVLAKELVFSTDGDTIFYIIPGALIALLLDGEILWSFSLGNNSGIPIVDNINRVYLYGSQSGSRYLFCINPDGSENWKFPFSTSTEYFENYSSPTIDGYGNIIFQTSTDDSGYVYSVDYYGNLNWKTTLGHYGIDGAFINHGLVCDAEGKIYCGSSLGLSTNFWCIDSDGTILWKLDLEGYQYDTSPAIGSDGTLYIGTHLSSLSQNQTKNLIAVRDTVTSVEDEFVGHIAYKLGQNYPNPFNATTKIRFTILESGIVSLKVFNIMGEEVVTLIDKFQQAGSYDVLYQADDLASGIYFYTLSSGDFTSTKKLILLK
jgi:outer membrane protein assembly factor BamB